MAFFMREGADCFFFLPVNEKEEEEEEEVHEKE